MSALTDLSAPAKLNLFLHVTGRRADGYHLLQSAFVLIDWVDTLHIETRADGRLQRHDLGDPLPADDLCLRAATLLQAASGVTQGADIHIDKHIPSGAGMGGGSSDAATVLKALNQLWSLDWPIERLQQLAVQLGADVPFFVGGSHAWVEGIGDILTPLELPPALLEARVAVLKPPVVVPTPAIFASATLKRDTRPVAISAFLAAPRHFGHNDLQAPAEAYSPQVTEALERLQGRFGNSRMTGSGSAVFAWVDDPGVVSFTPADAGVADPAWVGRLSRILSKA